MYARDHALIATPIGTIRVEGDETALTAIRIGIDCDRATPQFAPVRAAAEQIAAYFAGELRDFDVALPPVASLRGRVLREGLVAVDYGATLSYGALARRLDSGPRAIGQLCARNPFPIIVPCHRIVAADGSLGSYSAGHGPVTKQWLLDHEQRHL
jgi:methylated-DNA-[protein]-cysteine S-methyltransferase